MTARFILSFLAIATLIGCSATKTQTKIDDDILAIVGADDAAVAQIGQSIMLQNGSVADAVVAMSFMAAASQPSRSSLASQGICVHFDAQVSDIRYYSLENESTSGLADVDFYPNMAVAMSQMHINHGYKAWASLLAPAEWKARFGFPIEEGIVTDYMLAKKRGDFIDPYFLSEVGIDGVPQVGQFIKLPHLAAAISNLRVNNIRTVFENEWSDKLQSEAISLGKNSKTLELKPIKEIDTIPVPINKFSVYFPANIPGNQAAILFQEIWQTNETGSIANKTKNIISDSGALTSSGQRSGGLSFFSIDRYGNAAGCVLSLNRPFGTGNYSKTLGGFLPANRGENISKNDRTPIVAVNDVQGRLYGFFISSGGNTAHFGNVLAAAEGLSDLNKKTNDIQRFGSGLIHAVLCPEGLAVREANTENRRHCSANSDPRGNGITYFLDR